MESVFTTTSGDEIAGNIIGTTPGKINDSPFSFQPLGNTGDGILITDGSTQNTIGGASAGAGNLIVSNQGNGIEIGGGPPIPMSYQAMPSVRPWPRAAESASGRRSISATMPMGSW